MKATSLLLKLSLTTLLCAIDDLLNSLRCVTGGSAFSGEYVVFLTWS